MKKGIKDNPPPLDIIPMVSKDHDRNYYVIPLKVYNSDLIKVTSYVEVTRYPLRSAAYACTREVVTWILIYFKAPLCLSVIEELFLVITVFSINILKTVIHFN